MKHLSLFVLFSLSLFGCYRPLGLEYADGGAADSGGGQPDLAIACTSLQSSACSARSDCKLVKCPGCGTSSTSSTCVDKNEDNPVCPLPVCVPCSQYTDAATCTAAKGQGCYVFDCCGFDRCLGPEDEPLFCAADCVGNCGDIKDEANCTATPYCHNVYQGCAPNETCGPNPEWKSCGDYQAQCTSSTVCDAVPPSCPTGYVPGIANGCYEGCVKQDACCATACDAGSTCQQCWFEYACLPDGAVC